MADGVGVTIKWKWNWQNQKQNAQALYDSTATNAITTFWSPQKSAFDASPEINCNYI